MKTTVSMYVEIKYAQYIVRQSNVADHSVPLDEARVIPNMSHCCRHDAIGQNYSHGRDSQPN